MTFHIVVTRYLKRSNLRDERLFCLTVLCIQSVMLVDAWWQCQACPWWQESVFLPGQIKKQRKSDADTLFMFHFYYSLWDLDAWQDTAHIHGGSGTSPETHQRCPINLIIHSGWQSKFTNFSSLQLSLPKIYSASFTPKYDPSCFHPHMPQVHLQNLFYFLFPRKIHLSTHPDRALLFS